MKLLLHPIMFLLLFNLLQAEEHIPSEVQRIINIREAEIAKIDERYCEALKRLKGKYTRSGDLDTANAIVDLIEEVEIPFGEWIRTVQLRGRRVKEFTVKSQEIIFSEDWSPRILNIDDLNQKITFLWNSGHRGELVINADRTKGYYTMRIGKERFPIEVID